MNTETKKQEAIRLAWNEFNGSSTFDEHKELINENGYMTLWDFLKNIGKIRKGLQSKKGIQDDFIRPKSLQGIENNNGWIKIESEEDLPEEESDKIYWIESENGWIKDTVFHAWSVIKKYKHGTCVKYKEIEKPKPSIF